MTVSIPATFTAFTEIVRALLFARVPPEKITWDDPSAVQRGLFESAVPAVPVPDARAPAIDATFARRAARVFRHRDPARAGVLYRLAWQLSAGARGAFENPLDPDAARFKTLDREVEHDEHRMKAFVRFREVQAEDGRPWFVAWYRPDHAIVESVAPFFAERFSDMRWSILTPRCSVHWDERLLSFGPGAGASEAPAEDAVESLWRTYYAAAFNPARASPAVFTAKIPERFRAAMPELAQVPALLRDSAQRVAAMRAGRTGAATAWLPQVRDLEQLRDAARGCTACALCGPATQTVFGEGPRGARLVLVGEQPGDQEDRIGRPFVGPAGALLDGALAEAGIDRARVYLTNAVKHFKFDTVTFPPYRLHKKPSAREIADCAPWLHAELEVIVPDRIVALGASAARALLGPRIGIRSSRGRRLASEWGEVVPTWHPSAVLRADDDRTRAAMRTELVADLRVAAEGIAGVT